MLRFTKIEEESIPRKYNKLKAEIEGFLSMNVKVAKIECGNDYKNTKAAVGTFRNCIMRHGFLKLVISFTAVLFLASCSSGQDFSCSRG